MTFSNEILKNIRNSTLQPWLDFNASLPLGFSPSCAIEQSQNTSSRDLKSCIHVCNDTFELLQPDQPQNLLTCGVWTALTVAKHVSIEWTDAGSPTEPEGFRIQPLLIDQNLHQFESLGLSFSDSTYITSAMSAIAHSLSQLEETTRTRDLLGEFQGIGLCTQDRIFDIHKWLNSNVGVCLSSICGPSYIDQDLGGIGVFVSLHMQLGFAFLILIGVLCLAMYLPISDTKVVKHFLNLTTGLIEFHKAQCYFISAIQLAAIILYNFQYNFLDHVGLTRTQDVLLLFIPIALSGMVPIVFTLQNVLLFARMSWHVLVLSFLPLCLSVIVWVKVYTFPAWSTNPYWSELSESDFADPDASLTRQLLFETAKKSCGSMSGNLRYGPSWTDFNPSLIWTIYAYCLAWALICLGKHIINTPKKSTFRSRLRTSLLGFAQQVLPHRFPTRVLAASLYAFSLVVWILCFAYTFYLYNLFIQANAISKTWSFGQVIGINTWTPFIVELIYLELWGFENGSRYRYPPGAQAFVYGVLAYRTSKDHDPESHSNDNFTYAQEEETSLFQRLRSRLKSKTRK